MVPPHLSLSLLQIYVPLERVYYPFRHNNIGSQRARSACEQRGGIMKGLIRVVLVGVAIPAVGYLISFLVLADLNSDLAKENLPPIHEICAVEAARTVGEVRALCAEVWPISVLRRASIIAGIAGGSMPVLFWLAALVAGQHRQRIATIFPLVVRLSLIVLSLSLLAQGAILTYGAFLAESYFIGRVHFILIGAIGLGALVGAIGLLSASKSLSKRLETQVIGKRLSRKDAPRLHEFVTALANKLGAKPPQHIVVGLDTNFFVTNADVSLLGTERPLRGQTLFLSAPLSRLLNVQEFAAVIGHELGHFRGGDTEYSLKFAPVYAGLGSAINSLVANEEEGASAWAKIPAVWTLSYMMEVFSFNERAISRDREFHADRAGAEAASAQALATALIKVSLYSGLWDHARSVNVERLKRGKIAANLSAVFVDIAKYDVEHESLENIKAEILSKQIAHPTDTHPPTHERLTALGMSPAGVTRELLLIPSSPAIELIDGFADVEEELTVTEHKLMVHLGAVQASEVQQEPKDNYVLRATYALAAAMVNADGEVSPAEIASAERIGAELLADFDPIEFREVCRNAAQGPSIERVAEFMSSAIAVEHKPIILDYLRAIAAADGKHSLAEQELLERVTRLLYAAAPDGAAEAEAT